MTKKDYELIAKRFNTALSYYRKPENSNIRGEAIELFAYQLSDDLMYTNPRFDRNKFLQACGIEVTT